MGNCTFRGVLAQEQCTNNNNTIRIFTESGGMMKFKSPLMVEDIIVNRPGYGIFKQGLASTPLPGHEKLQSGQFYYLLPLEEDDVNSTKNMHKKEEIQENVCQGEHARVSSSGSSEFVENLAEGTDVEVLPSIGDGVWRVKFVISTKQLEEILAEEVVTEALIEKIRIAAAGASKSVSIPKRVKAAWNIGWRPTIYSVFKISNDNAK